MAIKLFGFTFGGRDVVKAEKPEQASFTLPSAAQLDDGAVTVTQNAYYGTYVDLEGSVRNAFERWMNGINSHNLNIRNPVAGTPLGYTVDGDVVQFSKTGESIKRYKFVGLFPTDITPIDVDWGSNDTIEEFSVTLTYQWWEAVADGVI